MSQEDIENFLVFTDTADRETAAVFIRANNNNIEAAVGAYFDNPDPAQYSNQNKWDDAAWGNDRAGGTTENSVIPYDESLVQYGPAAPSRPPSPSKRGAEHVEMGPWNQQDVWEGQAELMHQSQMEQETGVLDASGREYVPDVGLEGQKRRADAPAFIKPSLNQELLSSLITVLSTIPGFRARIYSDFDLLSDYGHDDEWWKGEDIQQVRIIDTSSEEQGGSSMMSVIYELQRLMAFLELTDRSYGSIASLVRSPHLLEVSERMEWSERLSINVFATALDYIAVQHSHHSPSPIFMNHVSEENEAGATREDTVGCFNLNLNLPPKDNKDISLHRVLEEYFWGDNRWLQGVGSVLLFRLQQTLPLTNVSIPTQLFMDRYHEANTADVREMRRDMSMLDDMQVTVDKKLQRLNTLRATKGNLDAMKIFDSAVGFLQKGQKEPNEDENVPSAAMSGSAEQLFKQLTQVQEHIHGLIKSAQLEKEKLGTRFKEIRSRLTEPTAEGEYQPKLRYTIQGVAISPNDKKSTTYIKRPEVDVATKPRQQDGATDADANAAWWKLTYDFSKTPAVVRTDKVEEATVLNASSNNRGDALLVYANDDMVQGREEAGIPEPLQRFVEADNRALQAETAADIAMVGSGMILDVDDEETINVSPLGGNTPPNEHDMDIDHIDVPIIEGMDPVPDPTNIGSNEVPDKAREMEEMKQPSSSMSLSRTPPNGPEHEGKSTGQPEGGGG